MYFNFCFSSLSGIPIGIMSSAIGLKICAIAAIKIKNEKEEKEKEA